MDSSKNIAQPLNLMSLRAEILKFNQLMRVLKAGSLRNKPCPCRSGKKYKYCCLKKVLNSKTPVKEILKLQKLWQQVHNKELKRTI